MTKKQPKEKLTEQPELLSRVPQNIIEGNTFTGIHWDAKAVEGANQLASAILQNGRCIEKLTDLYRSTGVSFGPMIKVSSRPNDPTSIIGNFSKKDMSTPDLHKKDSDE